MVCLEAPYGFHAVAQFYEEFHQVEDEEVVRLLSKHSPGARHGAIV
jgi:predicted phosphoribosyltransferase